MYWSFLVNKFQDFRDFLKVLHKLTSISMLFSVLWRQNFKQSRKPLKTDFCIYKPQISYIGHIQVIKTQDVDVVRRRKTLKTRPSIPKY